MQMSEPTLNCCWGCPSVTPRMALSIEIDCFMMMTLLTGENKTLCKILFQMEAKVGSGGAARHLMEIQFPEGIAQGYYSV